MKTSTRRHFARHVDPLIAARERRQALARDKARGADDLPLRLEILAAVKGHEKAFAEAVTALPEWQAGESAKYEYRNGRATLAALWDASQAADAAADAVTAPLETAFLADIEARHGLRGLALAAELRGLDYHGRKAIEARGERAAFDKAIGDLARKAEIEYEGPRRKPRETIPAPGVRGVTFEVAIWHDSDHSFADLMGEGIAAIPPNSEGESTAASAPWSPKRATAHARARSDRESGRHWRGSRHGSASDAAGDLDVSEVLKGHIECAARGLSRHEKWERAKARTLDAADFYREDARRWQNDDLTAVGVEVIARGPDGHEIGRDSLWGVDCRATAESIDYLAHVAAECADTVIRALPGALSTRVEELRKIVAQYEIAEGDAS